jgi:hypothetical protein
MIYGYARVSTDGQSVDAQVRQLTKAGCKKVFREAGGLRDRPSFSAGTERCYGAGGEEMATSSLHKPMECRDAPAERLEQVPRRRGPK